MKQALFVFLVLIGLASCSPKVDTLHYNEETGFYEISSAEELYLLSHLQLYDSVLKNSDTKEVIPGNPGNKMNICLTNDIEIKNGFSPIDCFYIPIDVFDGNGHSIIFNNVERIVTDKEVEADISLSTIQFGLLGSIENATIKNLKLEGDILVKVKRKEHGTDLHIGALAGDAEGLRIENCQNGVNIKVEKDKDCQDLSIYVGGYVGSLTEGRKRDTAPGTRLLKVLPTFADKVSYDGTIDITSGDRIILGGIVGYLDNVLIEQNAQIENRGKILANWENLPKTAFYTIGGIFGETLSLTDNIFHCYNYADITALGKGNDSYLNIGGVIGEAGTKKEITLSDMKNQGTINVNCESSLVLGGVIGSVKGLGKARYLLDMTNEGKIIVGGRPKKLSDVGGVVGSGRCHLHKLTNKGSIQLEGNYDDIYVGGVAGSCDINFVCKVFSCCRNEDDKYPLVAKASNISRYEFEFCPIH